MFDNDSCNKLRTRLNKGTIVKCDIEHYGVDFTWGIKGHTARVETPEKTLRRYGSFWVSECNNDKIENRKYPKSLFRYNTQEFFYPEILRDIMLFDKNSKIYDVLIDDKISLNEYSRQKGFELTLKKKRKVFVEKRNSFTLTKIRI